MHEDRNAYHELNMLHWSHDKTIVLITVCGEQSVQDFFDSSYQNKVVYQEIAALFRLNDSNYGVTWQQCPKTS